MSDPQKIGEGLLEHIGAHFDRVRHWQQSEDGKLARARWEKQQEEKRRKEHEEILDLRGVPGDKSIRRWAHTRGPAGELFDAVREIRKWQRAQEADGGKVPAIRIFSGAPGTGKTSALSWAVGAWSRPAKYITADAICRIREEAVWEGARKISLLALDELGIEAHPEKITELLLARWSEGLLTLCGTNLSMNELIDRYMQAAGARLFDRLRGQRASGLRAFILVSGTSYRGGSL